MQIARNTIARFHYQLNDEQGELIEDSRSGEPMAYLHGHGNILPALEEQLEGKVAGDRLSVKLAAAQAYGERNPEALQRIPLKHIVHRGRLQPGMVVGVQTGDGVRQVTVLKVGKFNVDVDTNHPLAGVALDFDVEILEVRAASEEELAHGHVHGEGGHHH